MKVLKNNLFRVLIFTIVILAVLFFNLIKGMHPILDFLQYLVQKDLFWIIPLLLVVLLIFWQHNINVKEKISNERVEIFSATIRTIQDVLQNSTSSMQLLILDMKDKGIHEEIIIRAEKNIVELKKAINTLASVDPKSIKLKELNHNMSIIKMNE
ncbi:MAG: hypothetical protein M1480_15475 [Bacteroidetes bacterium]|nr:hypothetical protein [Bacteroidota bacterium]